MDINEIENDIDRLEAAESEYKLELGVIQSELDKLRNQKRALELAAFWKANPGLEIAVGDALIVSETWATIAAQTNKQTGAKVGEVITIEAIQIRDGICDFQVRSYFGIRGGCPLEIVRAMRQAWLDKNG